MWTRFSWFAFDSPSTNAAADGVAGIDQWVSFDGEDGPTIRDLEALLIAALQPFANKSRTRFGEAEKWTQVATRRPDVLLFDELKKRL